MIAALHIGRLLAAALLLCGAAGCRRGPTTPLGGLPDPKAGPRVELPDGGMRHSARLAVSRWGVGGYFSACGRLTPDFTQPGRMTKCTVARPSNTAIASDGGAAPVESEVGLVEDNSAPDSAPGNCRVALDDVPGDPGAPATHATLIGPTARTPLDSWKPPAEVDGDYFAIEISWSPDGKWIAIVHTAVGRGDGDQRVDVVSVEVRPAPACR